MTAALQQLVALQSRVWEFLARVTPAQLADLADGTLTFTLVPGGNPAPEALAPPPPKVMPAAPSTVPAKPPAKPRSIGTRRTTKPALDPTEAAAKLRAMDSVDEGAAYLAGFKLLKADLLALGRELELPIPAKTVTDDIIKLVLNQAIGARRKFEGLSKW